MLVVDSSVWIDYFRDAPTPAARKLDSLLEGPELLAVPDLALTEVLQGIRHERVFEDVLGRLSRQPLVRIVDRHIAVQAARNYRTLRDLGVTVRKTIDTLIATRCIVDGHSLLASDRDFEPFATHLGLKLV